MAQYEQSGPSPAEARGDELQKIVQGSDPAIGLKMKYIGRRGRDKINAILEKYIPDSLATEKNQYAPFSSYRAYYMSGVGYPVKVDAMNAAVAKALNEIKEQQVRRGVDKRIERIHSLQEKEKDKKKTGKTQGGRRHKTKKKRRKTKRKKHRKTKREKHRKTKRCRKRTKRHRK